MPKRTSELKAYPKGKVTKSEDTEPSVLTHHNICWLSDGGDLKPGLSNVLILAGSTGSSKWAAFDMDWTVIKVL